MSVLKRRSRMISIRLSDEEYTGLKRLCVVKGARSISDMARAAMTGLLADGGAEEMRMQLVGLHRKLDEISVRLSSHVKVD